MPGSKVRQSVAGAQRYIISKNPQMLSDQSFVAARLAGAAGEGDAAGVQDHYFVGELEGEPDVLLDEQDRLAFGLRSEEHTSELQSPCNLVCRLLLEKKKTELGTRQPQSD